MNAKSEFAARLIALRKDKGVSQYAMADSLGMSRSTYSGYESEGKQPDYECLARIAAFLDTSTDYLLGCSPVAHPSADVLTNDCINYKKHRDALPAEQQKVVDLLFDDFYLMVSKEMQCGNYTKLAVYGELFKQLRSGSAEIQLLLGGKSAGFSTASLADVVSVQNSMKGALSETVDKLLQAELSGSAKQTDK